MGRKSLWSLSIVQIQLSSSFQIDPEPLASKLTHNQHSCKMAPWGNGVPAQRYSRTKWEPNSLNCFLLSTIYFCFIDNLICLFMLQSHKAFSQQIKSIHMDHQGLQQEDMPKVESLECTYFKEKIIHQKEELSLKHILLGHVLFRYDENQCLYSPATDRKRGNFI